MLPEIVIMKTEENQQSMENTCVKSGTIRFLSSISASVESDFTIKYLYHLFIFIFIHQHGIGGRRRKGTIQLILSLGSSIMLSSQKVKG